MSESRNLEVREAVSVGLSSAKDRLCQVLSAARVALQSGRLQQAADLLDDRTVAIISDTLPPDPAQKSLLFELAEILWKTGKEAQAEKCYEKILALGPDAAAYNKLGSLYQYMGRIHEALQCQRQAVEAEPDRPELWANLARVLMETGDLQEGIDLLRKALKAMPGNAQAHSNLLFRLHQLQNLDPQKLFAEHRQWGRIHAPPAMAAPSHDNVYDVDRKLRVGYISPDFRRHSVAYFFESLLDGHNRRAVELYGYGSVEFPDQVTERLKEKFDFYRDIRNVDDDAAAALIRQDSIDILVDLSGHVGDNRLLVLARKPAPIQVTYLGYPDTTGMQAIDYRLTDMLADRPEAQKLHTEELVFLPEGFLCYRPPDFAPPVAPLPAGEKGYITFGTFNNNCKINPVIGKIWAEVLGSVPGSRLLLKLKGGDALQLRDRYIRRFERWGVDPARVGLCGWKSPDQHLQLYGQIDIALDTYPYNGTTTTCEALWMGVPVITLIGQCHASRVGLSILNRVGLEFFAASTPGEYVAKAVSLATSRAALGRIRDSMRARIAASGLCYAKGFARHVEAAYRQMWRRWCRGRRPPRTGGPCGKESGL
ncbi:MAG: tetratricopeptide repeat protein [Phycisphaerales bacterium]|nr:MAG: tetratricopeptide repeat protein [Phycisphaerales bacterium]